jgi:hypothetical protein
MCGQKYWLLWSRAFLPPIITFVFPVLSQIFWFFKIGAKVGYTNNWFCIATMIYADLWVVVFAGVAIAGNRS